MSTFTETESRSETTESPSENTENRFTILVATDIHLGYNEKDPIRGNDSFTTFEEILSHAQLYEVDFILLGGDLFHDATPSQNSMQRCLTALRRYTLGDKPIPFEFLSEQSTNFQESLNQTVNYEDPNLNVSYPVFSIHGNHDDPSGFGRLSSLDILSTTGLVNYFGKWTDLTQIDIKPILMRKGTTQLALYGLSHIHDNRLCRLFANSKVTLEQPATDAGEWFNLLVLHQNRANRGEKNYLPENILPDFLDLIIWGHEHDCRIIPEENSTKNFYVSQPGSSVATSLSQGESLPKHIGLLKIDNGQFLMTPIPLQTVRPFVFDTIELKDLGEDDGLDEGDISEKVQRMAAEKIEKMLVQAKGQLTSNKYQPKEPLIRLRLEYVEEDQMFNPIRFGQQYNTQVANPMDVILFKKKVRRQKIDLKPFDDDAMDGVFGRESTADEDFNVEDMVAMYFASLDDDQQLDVLFTKSMSELCRRLVENDDVDAAENIIKFHKEKALEYLNEKCSPEDEVHNELLNLRSNSDQIYTNMLTMLDDRGSKRVTSAATNKDAIIVDDDSDDDMPIVNGGSKATKAATSKRATAAATPKAATAAATSKAATAPARGRGSRGGRGGAAAAKTSVSGVSTTDSAKTTPAAAAKQPKIDAAISRTRNQSAAKKPARFTQYISDSDDD